MLPLKNGKPGPESLTLEEQKKLKEEIKKTFGDRSIPPLPPPNRKYLAG